jgi:hypothetical protein
MAPPEAPGRRSGASRRTLGPQGCQQSAVKVLYQTAGTVFHTSCAAHLSYDTADTGRGEQGVGISVHRLRSHLRFEWCLARAGRTSSTSSSLRVPLSF